MKFCIILVSLVVLSGCTHFYQEMTREQQVERLKKIGIGVGGAVIGGVLAHDSDSVTINQHHDDCHPPGHCRD